MSGRRADVSPVGISPVDVRLVHEAGEWAAFIRSTPLAGTGASSNAAVDDLVDAVREYEEDWTERLRFAPNHQSLRNVAELAGRLTEDELRAWLVGLIPGPCTPMSRP